MFKSSYEGRLIFLEPGYCIVTVRSQVWKQLMSGNSRLCSSSLVVISCPVINHSHGELQPDIMVVFEAIGKTVWWQATLCALIPVCVSECSSNDSVCT